jgi:hypothetical protein
VVRLPDDLAEMLTSDSRRLERANLEVDPDSKEVVS